MEHISGILDRIEMRLALKLFPWISQKLQLEEPWWIQYDRENEVSHD
jgi:hypothetical protein